MSMRSNLKEEREALKLTQQDCAVILGVSRVTYNRWEQDLDTMPLGKFEEILTKFEQLRKLKEK